MELEKIAHTGGAQLTLSWENVNVYTKSPGFSVTQLCKKEPFQPKHIVQNVSGIARPGELLGKFRISSTVQHLNIPSYNSTLSFEAMMVNMALEDENFVSSSLKILLLL